MKMPTGWICPRCKAVNAPSVPRCDCSDPGAGRPAKLKPKPPKLSAEMQAFLAKGAPPTGEPIDEPASLKKVVQIAPPVTPVKLAEALNVPLFIVIGDLMDLECFAKKDDEITVVLAEQVCLKRNHILAA